MTYLSQQTARSLFLRLVTYLDILLSRTRTTIKCVNIIALLTLSTYLLNHTMSPKIDILNTRVPENGHILNTRVPENGHILNTRVLENGPKSSKACVRALVESHYLHPRKWASLQLTCTGAHRPLKQAQPVESKAPKLARCQHPKIWQYDVPVIKILLVRPKASH